MLKNPFKNIPGSGSIPISNRSFLFPNSQKNPSTSFGVFLLTDKQNLLGGGKKQSCHPPSSTALSCLLCLILKVRQRCQCCDIMLLYFLSLSVVITVVPHILKQIAEHFSKSAPPFIEVPTLISESDAVSLFNCRSETCLFRSAYTTTYLSTPPQSFILFLLPQTALSLAAMPMHSCVGAHKNTLWLGFFEMFSALFYSLSSVVSV